MPHVRQSHARPTHVMPGRPHRRPVLLTLLTLVSLAAALSVPARSLVPTAASTTAPHTVIGAASTDCVDGLVYDDGALNEAVRFGAETTEVDAVMRFDVGTVNTPLEQLCVCWNRENLPAGASFDHELVFFAADGIGGQPGTQIAAVPFTRSDVPAFPTSTFLSYDLTPFDVRTTTPQIYAGVRWASGSAGSGNVVLCTDQDGPGEQPMYVAEAGVGNWTTTDDIFADSPLSPPTALMIRLETEAPPPVCPQEPCVEDDVTLCLQDDRFKVTATFETPQGDSGTAEADEITGDTGYFTFFNPDNVEVVIKVLNGCPVNGNYWVFAGGLTNVEVDIEVCDTQEGVLATYRNPLRTQFQPIQDTGAFETCP